ncbi:hypothetical protein Leryth_021634 [Lithospermum erythrorhizon]|nr:hypothetical protein Leryth_021634 [Lithospermum erythrorhizon]
MAKDAIFLLTIIASSLIMGSFAGSWNEEEEVAFAKKKVDESIHVAGKVLCQDCAEGWAQWVNGTDPIKGAKVSVTCMDKRKRVIYYGSDLTDKIGHFDIIMKKYQGKKPVDPKLCYLRLVKSPDPICHIATNFAGGKSGVKLRRPTMVYRDTIKYIVGPFYYTTPMCDEPDTTDD